MAFSNTTHHFSIHSYFSALTTHANLKCSEHSSFSPGNLISIPTLSVQICILSGEVFFKLLYLAGMYLLLLWVWYSTSARLAPESDNRTEDCEPLHCSRRDLLSCSQGRGADRSSNLLSIRDQMTDRCISRWTWILDELYWTQFLDHDIVSIY